jgi:hypothetical protein
MALAGTVIEQLILTEGRRKLYMAGARLLRYDLIIACRQLWPIASGPGKALAR